MPIAEGQPVKATDFLRRQHEEVARLFEAIESADGAAEKKDRFLELACMLVGHDRIEREIFYPVCEEAMGLAGERGDALVEHGVIKFSLYEANAALGQDDFDLKLRALKEMVEHHVAEEEREFFPRVEQALDVDSLEFLTEEMLEALEDYLSTEFQDSRKSA
jgi:hemerythrin superfamily protein